MDDQIRLSQEAEKLNECKKIKILNNKFKIIEKTKKKKKKKKRKKRKKRKKENRRNLRNQRKRRKRKMMMI